VTSRVPNLRRSVNFRGLDANAGLAIRRRSLGEREAASQLVGVRQNTDHAMNDASSLNDPAILRRFEHPDEVRQFERGRFEIVHIAGMTIGRATYEPGWKWSEHVGRATGRTHCDVEHLGYVLSGRAVAAFPDGRVIELTAGGLFYISPEPHDSWVLGDEPYVSLHLMGAGHYAKGV
jgi:hypothetical protein